MAGITIFKTKTALPEFYGRVYINNNQIEVDGVTCVFKKYLELGIVDENNKKVFPQDESIFLDRLKSYLKKEGMSFFDLT